MPKRHISEEMKEWDMIRDYSERVGIKKVNVYGRYLYTSENNIVFPNGWVAWVIPNYNPSKDAKYSISVCDYRESFNPFILNEYGAENGYFYCNTVKEVINACEIIRKLEPKKIWFI